MNTQERTITGDDWKRSLIAARNRTAKHRDHTPKHAFVLEALRRGYSVGAIQRASDVPEGVITAWREAAAIPPAAPGGNRKLPPLDPPPSDSDLLATRYPLPATSK